MVGGLPYPLETREADNAFCFIGCLCEEVQAKILVFLQM
jgi:hypothetical protein